MDGQVVVDTDYPSRDEVITYLVLHGFVLTKLDLMGHHLRIKRQERHHEGYIDGFTWALHIGGASPPNNYEVMDWEMLPYVPAWVTWFNLIDIVSQIQ